ncbi:uncharacterized protein LOC128955106 [Oppia nitens]|uniref:uncharacterized protein LOC128955106 n=1 Tax=Oppia nitens TaxID=1686743 RepID=UPI0023D998D5|nr:uncharacterized protein LOC128955106 [Oppia nitens]
MEDRVSKYFDQLTFADRHNPHPITKDEQLDYCDKYKLNELLKFTNDVVACVAKTGKLKRLILLSVKETKDPEVCEELADKPELLSEYRNKSQQMLAIGNKMFDVMADGIKSDTKLTVSMFNCYLKKWSTEICALLSPEARYYHIKRFDSTTGMVIDYLNNDSGIQTASECDWPKSDT